MKGSEGTFRLRSTSMRCLTLASVLMFYPGVQAKESCAKFVGGPGNKKAVAADSGATPAARRDIPALGKSGFDLHLERVGNLDRSRSGIGNYARASAACFADRTRNTADRTHNTRVLASFDSTLDVPARGTNKWEGRNEITREANENRDDSRGFAILALNRSFESIARGATSAASSRPANARRDISGRETNIGSREPAKSFITNGTLAQVANYDAYGNYANNSSLGFNDPCPMVDELLTLAWDLKRVANMKAESLWRDLDAGTRFNF